MEPVEYVKLLEKIQKSHTVIGKDGWRKIKYITCNYDTRDSSIYRITFREWFNADTVSFPRECDFGIRPRVKEMYEDIIAWLEKEEK